MTVALSQILCKSPIYPDPDKTGEIISAAVSAAICSCSLVYCTLKTIQFYPEERGDHLFYIRVIALSSVTMMAIYTINNLTTLIC